MTLLTLTNLKATGTTNPTGQDFTVEIPGSIPGEGHEIALHSAYVWYSYYNISSDYANQTLLYSIDAGVTWETAITIPPGSYSLPDIQSFIESQLFDRGHYTGTALQPVYHLQLNPNYNTLRTEVVLGTDYQLDLTVSNLYYLLGLESKIYTASETGTGVVNITNDVNSLSINCSVIEGSYDSGVSGNSIFTFIPNSPPGSLINLNPRNLVYLPLVGKSITRIRIWISDNLGRIVNLNGEATTVVLHHRRLRE